MSLANHILHQLNAVLLGKEGPVKLALCCLLSRGHLLIEDLPGTGKTTLSHALAATLGLGYQRVQFTSDMLPADLIGVSIYRQESGHFDFQPGPLFSQVLLADEINRASPKTQSALLEAMAEGQVSTDGHTYGLPQPFFVIATQNPVDQAGTYPLPESQLDRFAMRIALGFPPKEAEKALLKGQARAHQELQALLDTERLAELQAEVDQVRASDDLLDYLLALLKASRELPDVPRPLSPRAGKALLAAAKAWAWLAGRDYVLPEDIQAIFASVAEHRLSPVAQGGQQAYASLVLAAVDPVLS
ncbi:AAA family ATPase [Gallaecimonas xiamenensis]|uniref:MoxR protein n=1 Tax=Gallaecimonas xiamenensis 3-C-1 TaxID=745411 RepID=K2KIQ2_9GAMM|nr:AAA family ATPase [Gallaecimonas xiamenensis]EKE77115.1 MoxR protein [Gallaecimonas xiamenensis 3-C-1]